ncbi:MAG: hypothetical protein NT154_05955 [Verrucomicrobia bacterium]|nr:hypothetical protein [Verrucomicrobiota bacterium]
MEAQPKAPDHPASQKWDGIPMSPRFRGQDKRYISIGAKSITTNNLVTVIIEVGTEVPEKIAISLNSDLSKAPWISETNQVSWAIRKHDFSRAAWIPYTNQVVVDLGPDEGRHTIYGAAQWGGANTIQVTTIYVDVENTAPEIFITNPKQLLTSQPRADSRKRGALG